YRRDDIWGPGFERCTDDHDKFPDDVFSHVFGNSGFSSYHANTRSLFATNNRFVLQIDRNSSPNCGEHVNAGSQDQPHVFLRLEHQRSARRGTFPKISMLISTIIFPPGTSWSCIPPLVVHQRTTLAKVS